jgi:1-aminocyclopropane-1-carboxylate synthase
MSAFLNQHFSPVRPVEPSQLVGMAGMTALSEMLAFALADPGDGIMMCRPIYGRFEVDFGVKAGVKAVYASMEGRDPLGVQAVEMYERCLEEATKKGVVVRALLISNPHNPLGKYSLRCVVDGGPR